MNLKFIELEVRLLSEKMTNLCINIIEMKDYIKMQESLREKIDCLKDYIRTQENTIDYLRRDIQEIKDTLRIMQNYFQKN